MRAVVDGIHAYADAHDGRFPTNIADAAPYLKDASLHCPAVQHEPGDGKPADYQYLGKGLYRSDADCILLYCTYAEHYGLEKLQVVFVDRHHQSLPREEAETWIGAQAEITTRRVNGPASRSTATRGSHR